MNGSDSASTIFVERDPARVVPPTGRTFLAQLSVPDRAALESLGLVRQYRAGRFVMLEGERVGHVLVLRQGRVKVTSTTPQGRERLLAVRGPGELIGELSALGDDDDTCSAAVEALDLLIAQVITREDFLEYLDLHPRALIVLARSVIGRLKAADRRRMDFGCYDAPRRVARLLIEFAETHGRATADGIELDLSLSQEDLAGLIASSRESVARSLTSLRRLGLVTTGRRSIVVHDLEGLRRFAV